MKATCQNCQGNGQNECTKGYPHYGVAHICIKGFEPKDFLRNGKIAGITIDHFDNLAPSCFRAIGKWVCL